MERKRRNAFVPIIRRASQRDVKIRLFQYREGNDAGRARADHQIRLQLWIIRIRVVLPLELLAVLHNFCAGIVDTERRCTVVRHRNRNTCFLFRQLHRVDRNRVAALCLRRCLHRRGVQRRRTGLLISYHLYRIRNDRRRDDFAAQCVFALVFTGNTARNMHIIIILQLE